MNLEKLVSDMMTMSTKGRLWHWMTDTAQHHTTFEQFLTQNENLTDSFVESALGNDIPIKLSEVGVSSASCKSYTIDAARAEISDYRTEVIQMKEKLGESSQSGSEELLTVLDDVVELTSKTLYMLKLK